MASIDDLPIPELSDDLRHEIAVAVAEARDRLYLALDECWLEAFPEDLNLRRSRAEPSLFFGPFTQYGVAVYDAWASTLLKLRPTLNDYQAWLNFTLKTMICDGLAPYVPHDAPAKGPLDPLSEWQFHMSRTWQLSSHSDRQDLWPLAHRLINALEDPMSDHRSSFLSSLHRAISKRTAPLLTEALKQLGGPFTSSGTADQKEEIPNKPATAASWAEVEIRFLSDDRIEIRIGQATQSSNFAEFGCEDRRSGKPNQAWNALRILAENRGTLSQGSPGQPWRIVEKRVQEIRTLLRRNFKLSGDPLPFVKGSGYQARFKISCALSFNS